MPFKNRSCKREYMRKYYKLIKENRLRKEREQAQLLEQEEPETLEEPPAMNSEEPPMNSEDDLSDDNLGMSFFKLLKPSFKKLFRLNNFF